jgi:CYTH domain-containing protein
MTIQKKPVPPRGKKANAEAKPTFEAQPLLTYEELEKRAARLMDANNLLTLRIKELNAILTQRELLLEIPVYDANELHKSPGAGPIS